MINPPRNIIGKAAVTIRLIRQPLRYATMNPAKNMEELIMHVVTLSLIAPSK